jgi:hypothetical protein
MRLTKPSFQFASVYPLLPLPGDIFQCAGKLTTGRATVEAPSDANVLPIELEDDGQEQAGVDPMDTLEWTTYRDQRIQQFIAQHKLEQPGDPDADKQMAWWNHKIDDDIEHRKRMRSLMV